MYSLSCASMGGTNCDFVAKDDTQEGVIAKLMEHAKIAHPEKLADMTPEKMEAMKTMAMSKIVQE
jgi:predicted small metal-binding protein